MAQVTGKVAGDSPNERWSEPDSLVKYFWEFIGKRLDHMPRRSFHPRIAQAEEEAHTDSDLAFDNLVEKLGGGSEARHLVDQLESAKNHELGVSVDTAYIQGLQDGLLLAEKMKTGLVAWLAEAFPIPLKIERQDSSGEETST